ncbi:hypothetical protein [Salinibaculum rarum]|uniref:hypothetical protein n=1 Tax=Salinibaculum rarum TaxID=3058903 RepID=UPI00265FE757|nr:hypothetical protein [Salinibaculum sp. KK48]
MTDLADIVERSLTAETEATFTERVDRQAATLRDGIVAGEMDNDEFAVGLEMEVYAVARGATDTDAGEDGRLATLPASVFESAANKELGVHNAELNTDPNVLDGEGLAAQADSIAEQFAAGQAAAEAHDRELVLDAMWTIPPAEGSLDYLDTVEWHEDVAVARNMRPAPRYVAIDNHVRRLTDGHIDLDVPGASHTFQTILFESLATSIQPHLQIPSAGVFPTYYNTAIRTMGPVVALSANSPFLPADCYDTVSDPDSLVDKTHHELRIAAFEQSVNHTGESKVRVPGDLEDTSDVVDRVVEDDLYAPFLREWVHDGDRETFHDDHWEFDHKRGTYWRWLRCVVGGDPVGTGDERSLRIEYRPIPTQPTIRDVVGMQALTAGLVRGLVAADHPLADLAWDDAEQSFYSAVEDGLAADLAWVTSDGKRTTDSEAIFEEVFEFARHGLHESGVSAADIDHYLAPIESRWDDRTTPSAWKKDRVHDRLDDGMTLDAAITAMQRDYIDRSRQHSSFAEWL